MKSLRNVYQRDGAVVIRKLLSENMVKVLKRGIERNLRTPTNRAVTAYVVVFLSENFKHTVVS